MNTIKLPLIAALVCLTTVASAQEKAPRKPRVFAAEACEVTTIKSARVMVCVTAKRTAVLSEYAQVTMPDGSHWVVGR